MTSLRTAAFAAFAALVLSSAALQPAAAMPVANLAGLTGADVAKAQFTFGDPAGGLDRVDTVVAQAAAQTAAVSYFDFDAIITLGALALAGGAMAALGVAGARRREESAAPQPAWRESVFRAVQADLAAFTESYSRAA